MEEGPPSNRRWSPRAVCPSIRLVSMVQRGSYSDTTLKENSSAEETTFRIRCSKCLTNFFLCVPHMICDLTVFALFGLTHLKNERFGECYCICENNCTKLFVASERSCTKFDKLLQVM